MTNSIETREDLNNLIATLKVKQRTAYSITVMVFSLIAWLAAGALVLEYAKLKKDPNHVASCDFGGIFSCTSIMKTDQAHVFGFPNPWIGIFGFVLTFALGLALFINRKKENKVTQYAPILLQIGSVIGIAFICFFYITSVFVVAILCPWCMVVWTMTIPFFIYTTLFNIQNRSTRLTQQVRNILNPAYLGLAIGIGYLLPLTIAIVRFSLLHETSE